MPNASLATAFLRKLGTLKNHALMRNEQTRNASRCNCHHDKCTTPHHLTNLSSPPSASLNLPNPPSRYNSPSTLTLDLAPPIALIWRDQHHLLALSHARLAFAGRIVRVQRFDVSDSRLLRAAAPRSNGGTLLAAADGGCGGVDATCERGGGD